MARASQRTVKVWDPLVRIGHWALVASVALAWFTYKGFGVWHERIGYVSLVLVMLRVVWGWIGPRYARFLQFVLAPDATLRYAKRMLAHDDPRYVGHNPLGGWMVLTLLIAVALVCVSGWLYTTDKFWGMEWLETVHEALAVFLLGLVALHVSGVVMASCRYWENLIGAMIHGRKRQPTGDDVA